MSNENPQRETLILTSEEAREIVRGYNPYLKTISDENTDVDRWTESRTWVGQRISDGKFFMAYYQQGLTEYQEERPFENDEPEFTEVFKKERLVVVYE